MTLHTALTAFLALLADSVPLTPGSAGARARIVTQAAVFLDLLQ